MKQQPTQPTVRPQLKIYYKFVVTGNQAFCICQSLYVSTHLLDKHVDYFSTASSLRPQSLATRCQIRLCLTIGNIYFNCNVLIKTKVLLSLTRFKTSLHPVLFDFSEHTLKPRGRSWWSVILQSMTILVQWICNWKNRTTIPEVVSS